MKEAVEAVHKGMGYREAARGFNVPVETLRRRVIGAVQMDAKPGPPTVLSKEEEDLLAKYVVDMADMGFGLSREDVMQMAFTIAERTGKKHPFKDEHAGRGWYEGFKHRHPHLTLRSPQPLSYCRALCSNKAVVDDFFAKLGSVYGRLNLLTKPMQVYNADETGINVVYNPGKVVAMVGRRNVYSIAAAERGKNHTLLACVSASGCSLPPLMIYPRKRSVPEAMRLGAPPGTVFTVSDNGWMTKDIYLMWFQQFIHWIPPVRPVLLIQDGHCSHVSIEVIELARANSIHLLCLPPHTTHFLQPLDVGVFKSFKAAFSRACHKHVMERPGRVVTADIFASLVGEAWPLSITPLNIMSGFRKCGIQPFNPGEVGDRVLKVSQGVKTPPCPDESEEESPPFSTEKIELFQKRYAEGYDLDDPEYKVWLKLYHTKSVTSSGCRRNSPSSSEASPILSEILTLPKPPERKKKGTHRQAAVCITEDDVLEEMRKRQAEKSKKAELKNSKVRNKRNREGKKSSSIEDTLADMRISQDTDTCPICSKGEDESEEGTRWICCDKCETWLHFDCINMIDAPDTFVCFQCVN